MSQRELRELLAVENDMLETIHEFIRTNIKLHMLLHQAKAEPKSSKGFLKLLNNWKSLSNQLKEEIAENTKKLTKGNKWCNP